MHLAVVVPDVPFGASVQPIWIGERVLFVQPTKVEPGDKLHPQLMYALNDPTGKIVLQERIDVMMFQLGRVIGRNAPYIKQQRVGGKLLEAPRLSIYVSRSNVASIGLNQPHRLLLPPSHEPFLQ